MKLIMSCFVGFGIAYYLTVDHMVNGERAKAVGAPYGLRVEVQFPKEQLREDAVVLIVDLDNLCLTAPSAPTSSIS